MHLAPLQQSWRLRLRVGVHAPLDHENQLVLRVDAQLGVNVAHVGFRG